MSFERLEKNPEEARWEEIAKELYERTERLHRIWYNSKITDIERYHAIRDLFHEMLDSVLTQAGIPKDWYARFAQRQE